MSAPYVSRAPRSQSNSRATRAAARIAASRFGIASSRARTDDPIEARDDASARGIALAAGYVAVSIEAEGLEEAVASAKLTELRRLCLDTLRSGAGEIIVLERGGGFVFLCPAPLDVDAQNARTAATLIPRSATKVHFGAKIVGGVGRPTEAIAAYRTVEEARESMFIARRLFGASRVMPYEDLGIYPLLLRGGATSAELRAFADRILAPLRASTMRNIRPNSSARFVCTSMWDRTSRRRRPNSPCTDTPCSTVCDRSPTSAVTISTRPTTNSPCERRWRSMHSTHTNGKPTTKRDVLRAAKEGNVRIVRLSFVDILGISKNVTIPVSELERALDGAVTFDGGSIDGFVRGEEADMMLLPDLSTFAIYPWTANGSIEARLICDIATPDGEPFEGCPRTTLRRALEDASDVAAGLATALEIEFYLFDIGADGLPTTTSSDVGSYFDINESDRGETARLEIVTALESMGLGIASAHHEHGAGQHEIDLKDMGPLAAADALITVRTVAKQRRGAPRLACDVHAQALGNACGQRSPHLLHVRRAVVGRTR